MRILTFDSTLRDGTQGEGVSFSVEDKIAIAQKLDDLGIDYIEGGWPGSNPRDEAFFDQARELRLKHARLTAFGSTRLARNPVHEDRNVLALVRAGTPVISIFGKSWDLHVRDALSISLADNLELISETVRYVKDAGKELVYDAEHFFDGYIANPDYALRTLEAAKLAGADVLCLCDTNGGTPTSRLKRIVRQVRRRFDGVIGIHTHNDSDIAVANSLAAVEGGVTMVQGCMNGYGERCGNANLASIIANLELKLGHTTIGRAKLKSLSQVCRFIAEIANLPLRNDQSFVGKSAFAHKGGVHVNAVLKDASTYEHITPASVGNCQRVLVSDLAGRANIIYKLKEYGLDARLDDTARSSLLERIKQMEHDGYDLEAADGTFELLMRQALHPELQFFTEDSYEVTTGRDGDGPWYTEAQVTIYVEDELYSATSGGHGPLDALQRCVRNCLASRYPEIEELRLTDYKVRLLEDRKGMAAKVRVLIEWSGRGQKWSTACISDNVVEGSWKAMLDAIRLELMRLAETSQSDEIPVTHAV